MRFRKRLKKALPRRTRKRISGGVTKLTSAKPTFAVAPDTSTGADDGVLRMESASRLPTALAEASESGEPDAKPGALVLWITGLALFFIIIITWFIAHMPAKE
jgi:hypothetical protein